MPRIDPPIPPRQPGESAFEYEIRLQRVRLAEVAERERRVTQAVEELENQRFDPSIFAGEPVLENEEEPVPDQPELPERVRCSYAERNCLRRDGNGMVARVDNEGRRQTESCNECGQSFCIAHRHRQQHRIENFCHAHRRYHARCVTTQVCDSCAHRFCEPTRHEAGDNDCNEWNESAEEPLPDDSDPYGNGGTGYYNGPWREAELLFEGDTPVPGLAEGKRYVSFELEEEVRPGGSAQFSLPGKFGITTDGSLSNGVEVTFPPSRMDALVDNARTAVAALRAGGFHATARCGMHTHIDLRDKVNDSKFLSHLFATFYAVEDILFAMQSAARHRNQFCVPLRNGWQFYDAYGKESQHFDFIYYKTPKTLAHKLRLQETKRYKGGPRYNAFNFHSVWYRGTLEVRLHEGCLDANTMLMWAELLQKIVARVERGITYPTLRKLLDMPVGAEKLSLFKRVFGLSDPLLHYVQSRIVTAHGRLRFTMPTRVRLGTPKKGRPKNIIPKRRFKATHRRCRWCGATISLDRRCPYCRRMPLFTRDEHGMQDEALMRIGMGQDDWGRRSPQLMTETEYRTITGHALEPQTEFAATNDRDR